MTDPFMTAVNLTLDKEKGYVFDPDDPGGETNWGLCKRSYPELDIKNLTREGAIPIYRRDFWESPRFDHVAGIFPKLAIKVFDLGVNCGQKTACMFLQRAINVVCAGDVPPRRQAVWRQKIVRILGGTVLRVDGSIGPVTLEVLRACPYPDALLMGLRGEAYVHYRALNPLYIPGWLTRLEA